MKTRRITALMLTLTIIASAFFIGGNAFSAAPSAKKKPAYKAGTTYSAVRVAQKKGNLTVYKSNLNLYVKNGSKKAVKLTDIAENIDDDDYYPIYFFTDGARVFYNCAYYDAENEYAGMKIYVYTAKTGKKKCLTSNGGYPVGGNKYGVVFWKRYTLYYTDINGVTEKILKIKKSDRLVNGTDREFDMVCFNGKIYCKTEKGRIEYDLISKKTRSFKGSAFTVSKSYLYYINANSNLIRMDKKGNKVRIDTKVSDIMGANDGKTVVYKKTNKHKIETVFRATGKKVYELTDAEALYNDVKEMYDNGIISNEVFWYHDTNIEKDLCEIGSCAAVIGDNICFTVGDAGDLIGMFLKINKNGGKAKLVMESGIGKDYIGYNALFCAIGNTIYYGINGRIKVK